MDPRTGERQRKLELVFNATNDFIFLVAIEYREHQGPSFTFDSVNDAYCDLAGLSREAIVGHSVDGLFPRERVKRARMQLEETIETGEVNRKDTIDFPRGPVVTDIATRVIDRG